MESLSTEHTEEMDSLRGAIVDAMNRFAGKHRSPVQHVWAQSVVFSTPALPTVQSKSAKGL